MNANWHTTVGALGAAILCCSINAGAVDRAIYKEGDTWTYRLTDGPTTYDGPVISTQIKTITKVGTDEFEMSVVTTSARGEKKASTELSSLDFNDFSQLPDAPRQEIRTWIWPVDEGKSWTYEVPGVAGKQVWEVRVKGWEEIQVPAGTFKAVKVERELISAPNMRGNRKVVVWYSPDAKVNVKFQVHASNGTVVTSNSIRELLSYRVQ
jgi:hypothetical protein